MKTLIKIIAVAAALGLSPAASVAQNALPAQPKTELQDITAVSQAAPAQPQEDSPKQAAIDAPAASDATVAQSTYASQVTDEPGHGHPEDRFGLQDHFPPIGMEAAGSPDPILL